VLVHEIAAQAVHGVGRIRDDAALFEKLNNALDFTWLRMVRVNGNKHGRLAAR
jgi:hypothetical protein